MLTTIDPVKNGDNRTALLLHDLVPGGTGYLAELATPERVFDLLREAWVIVSRCACRDEGRNSCHRCLLPFAPAGRQDLVSRAAAERHLRDLLTLGTGLTEPPEQLSWACTEEEPTPAIALESHLELYFRRTFVDLARSLSGTVTELPGVKGTAVQVVFPGARTWLLEPQVNVLDSKPDFILSSTDTQVPKIAISTDGYAYHAAPAHRATLAKDASKRQNLRDAGYVVLSITAADLAHPAPPAWWSDQGSAGLIARAPNTVAWLPRVKEGPLSILRTWLLDPSAGVQRSWANIVPLMLAIEAEHVPIEPDADLAEGAAALLGGAAVTPGGAVAYWRRFGHLGVLVRNQGSAVSIAAVLDDSASAVDHHDFKTSWRQWLSLGNSLQLHTIPVTWTTLSLVASGQARAPISPVARTDIAVGWQPALSVAETPLQKELISSLAAAKVPPPAELGEEIEGMIVDISWPTERIAVLYDGIDDHLRTEFAAAGWRLIPATLEDILAAWAEQEGSSVS